MRTDIENRLLEIARSVVIARSVKVDDTFLLDAVSESGAQTIGKAAGVDYNGMDEIFALAKKHQIQHLVSCYLYALGDVRLAKRFFSSVTFTVQQVRSADELSQALSVAKIRHVPLKGTVLRKLYPEDWMRNSCDIDVLVKDGDLEAAGRVLEALGYTKLDGLSAHDVTYTRGRIHVELHYLLLEEYRLPDVSRVLSEVWEHCEFGGGFVGTMSDEFFYFYHIAHMAKHFELGGCGIRTVLDTWVLNHCCDFNEAARGSLLVRGGLDKFDKCMRALADSWFCSDGGNASETLERFVLTGGAYGNVRNGVMVSKQMNGGRLSYLLHRLFAPYSQLKRYYPSLDGKPYLLPFYELRRWFDALRRDKRKYFYELGENIKRDEHSEKIGVMLNELGLNNTKVDNDENNNQ